MDESPPTRLPADLDEEAYMIVNWQGVKLSVRQVLLIIMSLGVWVVAFEMTASLLSVSKMLTGLLWSWLFIGGVLLAVLKKDGRTMEHYLTDRIVFAISDRHFILKQRTHHEVTVDEADWEELDEPYVNW